MAGVPQALYYPYKPSTWGAITALSLFSLTTIFHLYQLLRTRTWYWIPFVVGGIFEMFGFAARVVNAEQTPDWKFVPFVIQTLGILLAPALLSASIYMEMGRIILLADAESRSLIKKKWLTKIFVSGDVLSFAVQCIGGAMIIQKDTKTIDRGQDVVVIGLWLQIAWFGLFIANIVTFWTRLNHNPTAMSQSMPWKKHIYVQLAASTLIMIRCIYRVIEYMQGTKSPLMKHEIYHYMLDSLLMFLCMLLFHVWHPSEVRSLRIGGNVAVLFKIYKVRGQSKNNYPLSGVSSWNRLEERDYPYIAGVGK